MARMSGKISGKKKEMTGDFSITLRDVFSVLTGKDCSTYGRLLQYLRKSTGVIGGRTVILYTTPAALL